MSEDIKALVEHKITECYLRLLFSDDNIHADSGLSHWLKGHGPARRYSSFREWLKDNPKQSALKLQLTD